MKNLLLASVGALALCAALSGTADAQVSGTVSGSYAGSANGGGGNVWGANGSLTGMFAGNWGAEGTAGYHSISDGGGDIWNVGGSLFWAGVHGRLAATVDYHDWNALGGVHLTNYGAGGEWYAGSSFTVAAKGGGESGNGTSGGYAGGMLQWYIMPDFSLSGSVDYLGLSGVHFTSETAKLEWLFSHSVPVSVFGGYQHVDVSAGGFGGFGGVGGDIFFVGLKLYTNGTGAATLVDRQRSGSLGYISQSPLFLDTY